MTWAVTGTAFFVAELASQREDWWRLSLCMCGTSYSKAPWVFVVGMCVASLSFLLLGRSVRSVASELSATDAADAKRAWLMAGLVAAEGVLLAATAVTPYDVSPAFLFVHNIFGWGQAWMMAGSMVVVAFSAAHEPEVRRTSVAALSCMVALYSAFKLGLAPYSLAEIGSIAVVAVWSTWMLGWLDRLVMALRGGTRVPV